MNMSVVILFFHVYMYLDKPLEAEMASTGEDGLDSQMPGGTSGRTSPASSTGQSSDVSLIGDKDVVITDSMLAEEEKLRKNAEEDQQSEEIEVSIVLLEWQTHPRILHYV